MVSGRKKNSALRVERFHLHLTSTAWNLLSLSGQFNEDSYKFLFAQKSKFARQKLFYCCTLDTNLSNATPQLNVKKQASGICHFLV
jgi:hypothetical protein